MSTDLSGIRKKIERADQHILSLTAETHRFRDRCRCKVVEQFDSQTRTHAFFISGKPPEIKDWVAIIAGEAAHHLRSVLDHLVYQLAIHEADRTGHRISKSTQRGFPVCIQEPTTEKAKSRFAGKVQGLSATAITSIQQLQPYKLPLAERKDYALTVLHELNVIDKHRLLLVVAAALNIVSYSFGTKSPGVGEIDVFDPRNFRAFMALEDGAQVGHYTGNANMHVDIKTTFDIAFPQIGLSEFQSVVPRLQQLRDFVVRIVDTFETRFFT